MLRRTARRITRSGQPHPHPNFEQHGEIVPGSVLLTLFSRDMENAMLTTLDNAPSKTGNPSGGGRGNNPPRK